MLRKIDISGVWGFRADEELSGLDKRYSEKAPDDEIELPSTTSMQKKGRVNPKHEDGSLTDEYAYEGYAWYYKNVELGDTDGLTVELFLERTRLTRVWVNGKYAGEYDSLCTPHLYDITELAVSGENSICIMVSNTGYPTKGGHMTSPDTQSNWNGITGEMSVIISERKRIRALRAYPDAAAKSVRLEFETENVSEADMLIWGSSSSGKILDTLSVHLGENERSAVIPLGDDADLWDEYSPVIYTLKASLAGSADMAEVRFGLRDIRSEGLHIKINGRTVQLRGRHDGMIFPLTGAAPTTVEEWHEYLYTVKSWGFNHVRFHTCCPPEAAFTAADMLGIYMQPELPFWGTIAAVNDENYNADEQEYLVEEGRRILKAFGDHPSFAMMSLGNELWGSPERLGDILREYHALDDRHLYTQGSNNFQFFPNIQPEDDFFSGVRLDKKRLIRGSYAQCDAPLGFVQTERPNTSHSFDMHIFPETDADSADGGEEYIEIQYGTGVKRVKASHASGGLIPAKPMITHETGQYCSYPDYDEIPQYTGPLKPYDLELFRERLAEKGMAELAGSFHRASGMLAYNCYKLEIEAVMRSEYITGFQLLDLQDFTGQGTALVGMLNAFMREKPFVRDNHIREKWLGFCSDAAILAVIDSFVLTVGDTVVLPVLFRYTRPEKLKSKSISWRFGSQSGELAIPDGFYGIGKIGEITISPEEKGAAVLELEMQAARPADDILPEYSRNEYEFTVFDKLDITIPEHGASASGDSTVYIESSLEAAEELLKRGEKVLYMPRELPESVKGFYCTDFWCYPMFRSISESMGREVPVGTLGLLIDKNAPVLADFPCREYSQPQWYEIVSHADCPIIGDEAAGLPAAVRTIDNFERNGRLGFIYEAKVYGGGLLVCASRLWEIADKPEAKALYSSILKYMHSELFKPEMPFTPEELGLR